jgi:hypothetical protein
MLRRWRLSWFLLPFALMLPGESRGDEPARPSTVAPDQAQVERLIRQLGSTYFNEREAASRQLMKIGPPAMEALRAAAASSQDPEVRRRATNIATVIESTLDQLLLDYRSLGLPMPPADAPLVRYEADGVSLINGKVQPISYLLAFLLQAGNDTQPWVLLQGAFERQTAWDPKARDVKPEPDAVKDLGVGGDGLVLAIQCHARGWGKLAEHLLEQGQKDSPLSPHQALIKEAWSYWECQLTRPKIDRAPIANRLKDLIGRDKGLDSEPHRALLRSLELALVPSKAKPGSVEALIDGLVDYTSSAGALGACEPGDPYWRISERGFDAVPALIEHLDDDRLTRAGRGDKYFPSFNLRVGFIVTHLLWRLAGEDIGPDWFRCQQGYEVQKMEAKRWWDEARKVGEERYLLDHVLPRDASEGKSRYVNEDQLRVIQLKHPKHIPTLYRTVLDQRPELESGPLAEAVSQSKLPAQEKLDLFLYAAGHQDNRHRLPALGAIKELDPKQFDARLLTTIKAFPDDVAGPYWDCPEVRIARLATASDEPQVWQALEKVAKRATVGFRMELLSQFAYPRDKRHRPERLRLLASFLEDDTSREIGSSKKYEEPSLGAHGIYAGAPYRKLDVRDFVAMELAILLGIEVELNPERTPAEWAEIRGKVREAVVQALGKPK